MGKRWKVGLVLLAATGLAACLASCSSGDAVLAARAIHAYLPEVMVLAKDAMAITGTIDRAEASTVQVVSAKVQTELRELETASGAYAAAPSADGWTRMGAVVDALVSDADEGLLAALAIRDPASRAKARVVLSALDAAMHVVDGYLMTARTPEETKAVVAQRAVKLQSVVRYWMAEDQRRVELAFGARFDTLSDAGMRLGY